MSQLLRSTRVLRLAQVRRLPIRPLLLSTSPPCSWRLSRTAKSQPSRDQVSRSQRHFPMDKLLPFPRLLLAKLEVKQQLLHHAGARQADPSSQSQVINQPSYPLYSHLSLQRPLKDLRNPPLILQTLQILQIPPNQLMGLGWLVLQAKVRQQRQTESQAPVSLRQTTATMMQSHQQVRLQVAWLAVLLVSHLCSQ